MKDLLLRSPSNTLYSSLIFLAFSWLKTCGCTHNAQADCTSLMADRLMWGRRQPMVRTTALQITHVRACALSLLRLCHQNRGGLHDQQTCMKMKALNTMELYFFWLSSTSCWY